MMFDLGRELAGLYERWLMENFPEKIGNSDDLVKLVENHVHFEEFEIEIKKWLGEI